MKVLLLLYLIWVIVNLIETYFILELKFFVSTVDLFLSTVLIKDARVLAPVTRIKLGIFIYFINHSEFITVQWEKILSRANNNEIKCFEFGSTKRALRPHLRAIIAG